MFPELVLTFAAGLVAGVAIMLLVSFFDKEGK
jgi:capsular polysaccharide biosynthesis protein